MSLRPSILAVLAFASLTVAVAAQDDLEIDRWYARAERAHARGDWARSVELHERILAAEPDDAESEARLVRALFATGGRARLEELTKARLARHPDDRAILADRLDLLIGTGRDDEALELVAGQPEALRRGYWLSSIVARIHEERGRDEAAADIWKDLVARAKSEVVRDARDLVGLARAYRSYPHGGDYAEEALLAAQKAEPELLAARVELARVYGDEKEAPADMKRELAAALDLRPRWPDLLVLLAEAADLRLGQAEGDRRQAITEALAVDPQHPQALFLHGADLLGDGAWDEAEATFARALAVRPNHRPALSGLAARARLAGDEEGTEAALARVFAVDPTYGRAWRVIATALSDRRRWPEALEAMREAVAVDPRDYRLWDDLARYALWVGEEEEGAAALEKADELVRYGTVWRNNTRMVLGLLARHYRSHPTEHFVLKLHEEDEGVLAHLFPAFVEGSWDELVERYGFEPSSPILFEVFQRSKDFSVRTMGTRGLPALGVCFGTTVAMDSPRARRRGTYNWAATAHHEIAHVFTLQASRGRVPRWLTEGLSSWEEVRRDPSWGRDMEIELHDALASGELIGVLRFDEAFSTPRIGFAYYQGGLASQWIEERWGIEAIRAMLRLYGEDLRTEEVLRRALEIEPAAFDAAFAAWVTQRLAPLKRVPNYSPSAMARQAAAVAEGIDVVENRIRLAWGHFRSGRGFDSDAVLDELVKAGVEDPRIALLQGFRYLRFERPDRAREIFLALAESGFEDHDMFMVLAADAMRRDDGEASEAFLQRAAETNPWVVDPQRSPFLQLAVRRRAVGDMEGWAEWTARYCALVDTALEPRAELLAWHLREGRPENAIAIAEQMQRVAPFDAAIAAQHGEALLAVDAFARARVQFALAIAGGAEGEDEIAARIAIVRCLLALGDRRQAAVELEILLERAPDSAEARRLEGELERP